MTQSFKYVYSKISVYLWRDQAPSEMNTVINQVCMEVVAKNDQYTVLADGGVTQYLMAWNRKKFRWEFTNEDIPDDLTKNEGEISNFIIQSEKSRNQVET